MLSSKIIEWYHQNKRNLPWRETSNPYFIWLSEVILQQTRVDQGLEYYLRFIETYPTVFDLAGAHQEEVLRNWQGLGYYSRARNLHAAAQYIANELNGNFPSTFAELKKMKGVGDYTAAAISSIAFGEKKAVVDGNVYRVLSRLFEIDTPINSTDGIKKFSNLADSLINNKRPGDYNQAMMELGATICKPKKPLCPECPLAAECQSLKNQTQQNYPVKINKTKVRDRYFNYLVIENESKIFFQKRPQKGIWAGLFEFLLIETDKVVEDFQPLVKNLPDWIKPKEIAIGIPSSKIHLLSHQRINARFWPIDLAKVDDQTRINFFTEDEIEQLPKHQLIVNYLKDNPILKT
ncbi:A/G-specific adenine glycosylase [Jiulongibacter sediminis]|jgi:A/G-specific adenine glycosylase|uniref:A/G-specific adenine glycosylase n=1 Tax=Jiulongibacter sediminis TaxID=1605367 RepID=UPI0026F0D027|nr:A/G-specific adenine glycosylase [Jiulongibacter sediminis]